jgi:ABC-type molybdate transport system ATPase subunit
VADLGVPMIHVTHHRTEARALGDRVILLQKGRVVATGSVDELLPPDPPDRPDRPDEVS